MTDVFPRRNLPFGAVPWGRDMEDRSSTLQAASDRLSTEMLSQNRTTAAVTASLARQLKKLEELLEEIEELYQAIPKVFQTTETTSGFGLSGGWTTVKALTITPPENTNRVALTAFGQAVTQSTSDGLVAVSARIVINGQAGGVFEASVTPLGYFQAVVNPQHGRTFEVSGPFTVELQLNPEQASVYGYDPDNRATLTVISSFTGQTVE